MIMVFDPENNYRKSRERVGYTPRITTPPEAYADMGFKCGLEILLDGDRWRELAQRGYEYVREVFSIDKAIDRHLAVYQELTGVSRPDLKGTGA